jgi:NTP pyrophosphatase (non-canonical NTP hydrolase)
MNYDPLNGVYNIAQNIAIQAAEQQEELILKTVQEIGGKTYEHISVSKEKVVEAFQDYLRREEQLPRIKKPDVLRDAIATYGMTAQVDMAIEEMSELTKALCKERRTQLVPGKHAEAHANVIEEIADVAIMLKQLLIMFDKDGEIQKEVDYKIDRLEQRLQKAHKETGGQSV